MSDVEGEDTFDENEDTEAHETADGEGEGEEEQLGDEEGGEEEQQEEEEEEVGGVPFKQNNISAVFTISHEVNLTGAVVSSWTLVREVPEVRASVRALFIVALSTFCGGFVAIRL